MNIFKLSYRIVRPDDDAIYKAFGFKHHSDATQFYVHPNNQSISGTTTLCQPIGEAISLFSLLVSSVVNGNDNINGDYYSSDDGGKVFLSVVLPEDWRSNNVVEQEIYEYQAIVENSNISISAFDNLGRWIDGNMDHIHTLYKLLPCFMVLLARDCKQDFDLNALIQNYVDAPAADLFVNIHEDFYQNHKFDDYEISYTNLKGYDISDLVSFRDTYKVVTDNKNQLKMVNNEKITPFADDAFLE